VYNTVQGGPDSIVRGLASTPHEKFDRFIVSGLTKNLFAAPAGSLGLDLAALNIQRGRDHGLPGYNAWRVLCGLPRARSFDDLATEIPDVSTRTKRGPRPHLHLPDRAPVPRTQEGRPLLVREPGTVLAT